MYMICATGKHKFGDEYGLECPYCHVPCYPGTGTLDEIEFRNRAWLARTTDSIDKQIHAGKKRESIINSLPHMPWSWKEEAKLYENGQKRDGERWKKAELKKLKKLWDKNSVSTLSFWKYQAEKIFGRTLYAIERQLRACIHDEIFKYILKATPA